MANGDSADAAAASSLLSDPVNYDWTPVEHNPRPQLANLARLKSELKAEYPHFGTSNATSPQVATPTSRQRATDKEVVDFMYGESADATLIRLSNQFIPIVQDGADTLVYIGVPPQTKDQTDYEYSHVKRQFERPYLMRSQVLRDLGSKKFATLLGPKSKRTQRKLQAAGILKFVLQPEKLKYFIDLSPDIHDDEGLILLTELSVPAGARSWHKDARRFNITTSHVCGRDEFDIPPKPRYGPTHSADTALEKNHGIDESEENEEDFKESQDASEQPSHSKSKARRQSDAAKYQQLEEDDYSQLRHYTAIVRLLHAIVGNDPKLNSAPKAWTFCMLSKFFDCAHSNLVNRWVADWLIQSGNLNFIQINPSVAYRMGMAVEAVWLVKCSFSIMVGQKAFSDGACDTRSSTAAGNLLAKCDIDGLDDDEINRIDHAASALTRRVKETFHQLARDSGDWIQSRQNVHSEMAKLYRPETTNVARDNLLLAAKEDLNFYVRRLLHMGLVQRDYTKQHLGNVFMPPTTSGTHNDIPAALRPLTLQFWETLRQEDFITDFVDDDDSHRFWHRSLSSLIAEGVMTAEEARIPYVSKSDIARIIDQLNSMSFYQENDEVPISPKKKVKLSAEANPHIKPLIANATAHQQSDEFSSTRAVTTSTDSALQDHKQKGKQSDSQNYSFGSDPVWDGDFDVEGSTFRGSEQDDWEVLTDDEDMLSGSKTPTKEAPVQRLSLHITNPDIPTEDEITHPDSPSPRKAENVGRVFRSDSISERFSRSTLNDVPDMISTSSDYELVSPSLTARKRQFDGFSDKPNFQAQTNSSSSKFHEELPIREPVRGPIDDPDARRLQAFTSTYWSNKDTASKVQDLGNIVRSEPHTQWGVPLPSPVLPSPPTTLPQTDSKFRASDPKRPNHHIFLTPLLAEVSRQVSAVAVDMLTPGFMVDGSCGFDLPLTEVGTLMSLEENEYKYLPLWAGGYDDGSGGVFDDGAEILEAPDVADGGFRGGAMGIIPGVGSSIGGSVAGSEFEDISTESGMSTVGKASRLATDGTATVVSMDE